MKFDWSGAVKTYFKPWLLAWACAIFVSSAFLAALYPAAGIDFPRRFFAIADEMSPLAKLMFGGGLALVFTLLARVLSGSIGRAYLTIALAAAAIPAIVMGIIPTGYSRGFGIGFSGRQFEPVELACWTIGSFLAGLVFTRTRLRA